MFKKKLYLVDGTSLCYRSHFAIKLNNSSGFPTGAVYGFYKTLKKILSEQKPALIGICFDVSRKTYRQEKYKDYKIQRPPLPDDLKIQFPVIRKLIKALGIEIIEKKGYEADDVIASLSKKARKKNIEVVIVSSDKDLYQLLSDKGISIYNYSQHKFYDKDKFIKKYNFAPGLIVDYLSLSGDASDNIPGAKGIGKVGASRLIREFGSIDNIFKNIDKLKPKEAEKIKANKKRIILSRELVKLQEPPLDLEWGRLKAAEPDKGRLVDIFSQLEFKIPRDDTFGNICPKVKVEKDFSPARFKKLRLKRFVYFTRQDKIYIYNNRRQSVYEGRTGDFASIFSDSSLEKISFGFKSQMLDSPAVKIQPGSFDVKLAAYLVDSSLPDYNLSSLVALFLKEHYSQIEIKLYPYFIEKLYQAFKIKLKDYNLDELFYRIEMPLVEVLYKMQAQGITIDRKQLKSVISRVRKKTTAVKKEIYAASSGDFNLNSPKQLQEVLFVKLGIKPLKKTKTGYSTNEEVLSELAVNYPIAADILQYRQLNKLMTTYLLPLEKKAEASGAKLFTRFHQTGTQTGRLSSSSPNLQSIPAKGRFSFFLRKSFVPSSPGGFILSADYSQIELRILAHLSRDKRLVEAFANGRDIHSFTASLLFGVKEEEVGDAQRNTAKRVNFGIVYGMSPYGLAKELKISFEAAQEFIENYFRRYPGVEKYINSLMDKTHKKGYAETIFGRRRSLPQIYSHNPRLRDFARRQAVNAPIQGSCADIIKLAMVKIDRQIEEKKIPAKLIIQIHDELVFDLPGDCLGRLGGIVKNQMENCIDLAVPLRVDIKAGNNWAEAKEI